MGDSLKQYALAMLMLSTLTIASDGTSTFGNCAYAAHGRVPPAALGNLARANVSHWACAQLARGDGWEPLLTAERFKRDDPAMAHLLYDAATKMPLNSDGWPFSRPSAPTGDPALALARFFGLFGQKASVCLFGDSISRNLYADLRFARHAIASLSDSERARLNISQLPRLSFSFSMFGIDAHVPRKCHRLCKLRIARATVWEQQMHTRKCSAVVVEVAGLHYAADSESKQLKQRLRELVARLVAAKRLDEAAHYADVLRFEPMREGVALEVAALLGEEDRVPPMWKRDVAHVADILNRWATAAPDRIALLLPPNPQFFPVTGEFTSLHIRPTVVPLATSWTPFVSRQCGCQRLHPAIANATVSAQMGRWMRQLLAGNASLARVRFADTYAALESAHGLNLERSFVGCHNTGAKDVNGCQSSRDFMATVEGVRKPNPREALFVLARADDFCDCTHVGLHPQRLAAVANVLSNALEGLRSDTLPALQRARGGLAVGRGAVASPSR